MLRSMTGYGLGRATDGQRAFQVEIYSVNHRYLDISIRSHFDLGSLESDVRKLVRSSVKRGKVSVGVSSERVTAQEKVEVDVELARKYLEALRTLGAELSLGEKVSLEFIAGLPQVLKSSELARQDELLWPVLSSAVTEALTRLGAAREEEGSALEKEMRLHLAAAREVAELLHARAPVVVSELEARYRGRIETLLKGVPLEPDRLRTEVAFAADRVDVTEELARFRSHLDRFDRLLEQGGPAGRELEFLLQEMVREVTTLSAKSADEQMSELVIRAKSEMEKIREQVQNIE